MFELGQHTVDYNGYRGLGRLDMRLHLTSCNPPSPTNKQTTIHIDSPHHTPTKMLTEDAITSIGNRLLNPKGLKVTSSKILQNLWAGYGHIAQIDVVSLEDNTKKQSLILKTVTAPTPNAKHHDEGHLRKVISYQVEQYFYTAYAPKIPAEIAMVAKCVAGINEPAICCVPVIALALEDLRERFPVEVGERRGVLGERQVDAALRWLAGFHGFWWRGMEGVERGTVRLPPLEEVKRHVVGVVREGVWLNGGYT